MRIPVYSKCSNSSLEKYAEHFHVCSDIPRELGLHATTIPLFSWSRRGVFGDRVKTFNIGLTGEEFYIIDGFFLLYRNHVIKVYKYDDEFNCTCIKSIFSHLLVFLIEKKALNRRSRFFFYNVLLHLVKRNEKQYDSKLKSIMSCIGIDWLVDMKVYSNCVLCLYKNGERRLYNDFLRIITGTGGKSAENNTQSVNVSKSGIEIAYEDKPFNNVVEINGIRQHFFLDKSIYLLTRNSIIVLVFEE